VLYYLLDNTTTPTKPDPAARSRSHDQLDERSRVPLVLVAGRARGGAHSIAVSKASVKRQTRHLAFRRGHCAHVCGCSCVRGAGWSVGCAAAVASLCKGNVILHGPGAALPHGIASLASMCSPPSAISRPPRPACIWPVQRGARPALSLCKLLISCALCEIHALPIEPH
jgi:hypothetical protein